MPLLIEGLCRLEYRGDDFAGIVAINQTIERKRAVGRVSELNEWVTAITGQLGAGHTRWAIHGGVSE